MQCGDYLWPNRPFVHLPMSRNSLNHIRSLRLLRRPKRESDNKFNVSISFSRTTKKIFFDKTHRDEIANSLVQKTVWLIAFLLSDFNFAVIDPMKSVFQWRNQQQIDLIENNLKNAFCEAKLIWLGLVQALDVRNIWIPRASSRKTNDERNINHSKLWVSDDPTTLSQWLINNERRGERAPGNYAFLQLRKVSGSIHNSYGDALHRLLQFGHKVLIKLLIE